ncbi:hypothetical protein I7V34_00755 [Bacillus sp. V3]|nr:hypothetical protein I7V34_00755 [Bacillus sp. V3]
MEEKILGSAKGPKNLPAWFGAKILLVLKPKHQHRSVKKKKRKTSKVGIEVWTR